MSIDVAEAAGVPRAAAARPRRARWIALGVVGALLVGGATAALTYRQTVRSERQATYDAVSQSQIQQAFVVMQAVAYNRMSADDARAQVELELPYPFEPGRSLTVEVPRSRLGGESPIMQIDITSNNGDLPWWTGQPSEFMSVVVFGTYTNDENGATSDEGSCVRRLGSPYAPDLTEEVRLDNGYLANPCTTEQIGRFVTG